MENIEKALQGKDLHFKKIKDYDGNVEAFAVSNKFTFVNAVKVVTGTVFLIKHISDVWLAELSDIGIVYKCRDLEELCGSLVNYYAFEYVFERNEKHLFLQLLKLHRNDYVVTLTSNSLVITSDSLKKSVEVMLADTEDMWDFVEINDTRLTTRTATNQLMMKLVRLTDQK
ncbi:MAG: hypothetical protein ACFE0Q_14570 [Anaerolineae bacterium]